MQEAACRNGQLAVQLLCGNREIYISPASKASCEGDLVRISEHLA